jgi:hypothetical protein
LELNNRIPTTKFNLLYLQIEEFASDSFESESKPKKSVFNILLKTNKFQLLKNLLTRGFFYDTIAILITVAF